MLPRANPPTLRDGPTTWPRSCNYRGVQAIVLLLLFLAVMILVAQQPIDFGRSDFWVHAGSVEIFSRDLSNPRHTYGVDPAESDQPTSNEGLRARHFAPWEFLLSILKRTAAISSLQSILVGSLFSIAILFTGSILFGAELNKLTGQRWLTTLVPVSVLLLIGTGTGWSGNIYGSLLPIVAVYPSTLAISLGFIGWALVLKLLRNWRNLTALGLVLVSSLILTIHQLQFVFFMLFAVCILFFSQCEVATGAGRLKVGLLLLTALPLGALWPYFNPLQIMYTAAQLAPDVARGPSTFFAFEYIGPKFGVALLGVPLALWVPRQFRLVLVAYLSVTIFMWLVALLVDIPSAGHRWAVAALLGMQISLAFALSTVAQFACRGERRGLGPTVALAVCIGAVLWVVVDQAKLIQREYPDAFPFSMEFAGERDIHRWARFSSSMPAPLQHHTLVADPVASFALTAFGLTPAVFSARFTKKPYAPTVSMLSQLYAFKTPASQRCELLRSLGHEYYLLDGRRNDQRVLEDLDAMGEILYSAEGILLLRMRDTASCLELN